MKLPEEWTRAEAEGYAAHFASLQSDLLAQTKAQNELKEKLRRWLEINDESELVDGETGLGVELGPPPSSSSWDVTSMPETTIVSLAKRGVLTVVNGAFDALRKAGGGADLDDAVKYRMKGEGTRPLRTVVK